MPCDNSSGVGKRSENVVVTLKLRFKFFEFLDGGFHKRIIQISRCCHFIGGLARWGEIRRRPFDSRAATVGRVAHKAIGFALLRSVICHLVLRLDFFSGTPGPLPFSVMNSTPADSRAVQMASIFQRFDGKETFNVSAGSLCSQRSKALAACTCSLVIMPRSQDQLAMSVVHFEKPKPWRVVLDAHAANWPVFAPPQWPAFTPPLTPPQPTLPAVRRAVITALSPKQIYERCPHCRMRVRIQSK